MKLLPFEKYTWVTAAHREYLKSLEDYVSQSQYLPKFHIYPPTGLMNDPNGLSYYNGEYHVFYQWFPFEPNHGMKHWGHTKSKDLVNWHDCGVAITPDQEYEQHGAYSGNAIEKDGLLYLFYTANYKTPNGKIPKQALAVMDKEGKVTKSPKNPIIDGAPEGYKGEIRDPYVFKKGEQYVMLLGAWAEDDTGRILVYRSDGDLESWQYSGTLDLDMDCGYMLECPAYMEVNGKDVLIVSPMGLSPQGDKYHNRFASLYLVGELDLDSGKFIIEHQNEIDAGFDFYAPQTFRGKEGQPLMFGWFGCGEQPLHSDKDMWKHGLTMPRALSVTGNKLKSFVAPELLAQFKNSVSTENTAIAVNSSAFRLNTRVPNGCEETIISFGDSNDCWQLIVDTQSGKVAVDREGLDIKVDEEYGYRRQTAIKPHQAVEIDIFVDNSFVEVFINGGEKSFSLRVFNTKPEANTISATKTIPLDVSVYCG